MQVWSYDQLCTDFSRENKSHFRLLGIRKMTKFHRPIYVRCHRQKSSRHGDPGDRNLCAHADNDTCILLNDIRPVPSVRTWHRIKHDIFCHFRKRIRMQYRCAPLLLIVLVVCRVSDGREGRVIFMDTTSNINVGKCRSFPFPIWPHLSNWIHTYNF